MSTRSYVAIEIPSEKRGTKEEIILSGWWCGEFSRNLAGDYVSYDIPEDSGVMGIYIHYDGYSTADALMNYSYQEAWDIIKYGSRSSFTGDTDEDLGCCYINRSDEIPENCIPKFFKDIEEYKQKMKSDVFIEYASLMEINGKVKSYKL